MARLAEFAFIRIRPEGDFCMEFAKRPSQQASRMSYDGKSNRCRQTLLAPVATI